MSDNTGHTELPPIKSNVSVRLVDGAIVNGVVTEHGQKDGMPTFDFDYYHRTRDGQIIKASKWAWPEMVIQRKLVRVDINAASRPSLDWAITALLVPDSKTVTPYTELKATESLLVQEGISLRSMSPYPAWAATKPIGDGSGMNHVAEGPTRLIAGLRLILLMRNPTGSIEVPEHLLDAQSTINNQR